MEADASGSIVAQAATGDEVAFEHIMAAYHDDMVRVCFVVCHDVHIAQEAVQAAWPIAWQKLGSIRDPNRLRPWLLAVAANEARRLARRRGRRWLREIPVDQVPERATTATGADPAEQVRLVDLADALGRLDLDDRVIVGMRYAVGLSTDEIATATGMSARGVRARLARLLARLREDLGDD